MKKLFVLLLCLGISTAASAQLIFQLGDAAQAITVKAVDELRERGIITVDKDLMRCRVIENHRQAMLEKFRTLTEYENAYRQNGNSKRAKQVHDEIQLLRDSYKRLPIATDKQNYVKQMNKYYKETAPLVVKRIAKINQDLQVYKKEVTPISTEVGQRPSGDSGENIRGGSIGNMEIYIQSMTEDAIFFINGQKIENSHMTIPISGEGAFLIAVKGKGKTRKMVMEFTGGPNSTVDVKDEDNLVYSVDSGSFHGKTTLKAIEEKADFLVIQQPNSHCQWYAIAPNKLKLTFDAAFTIGLSVVGETTWARSSQRPGKTVNDQVHDDFKAKITISVGGRG